MPDPTPLPCFNFHSSAATNMLYFPDLSSLLTVLHENGRSVRGVAFVLLQLYSQWENGWQVAIEWVSGGTAPRKGGQSPFMELSPLTDTDQSHCGGESSLLTVAVFLPSGMAPNYGCPGIGLGKAYKVPFGACTEACLVTHRTGGRCRAGATASIPGVMTVNICGVLAMCQPSTPGGSCLQSILLTFLK